MEIIITLQDLIKDHPDGVLYMHLIVKRTQQCKAWGLEPDTLEWNGTQDDVLEDAQNDNEELPEPLVSALSEWADRALETFKRDQERVGFEEPCEGQCFSDNLLNPELPYEAVLSFEYEPDVDELED